MSAHGLLLQTSALVSQLQESTPWTIGSKISMSMTVSSLLLILLNALREQESKAKKGFAKVKQMAVKGLGKLSPSRTPHTDKPNTSPTTPPVASSKQTRKKPAVPKQLSPSREVDEDECSC